MRIPASFGIGGLRSKLLSQPNAIGERGALKVPGKGTKQKFDSTRV